MNQTEPTFDHLFELNNLKAKLQAKDTTIGKFKANIKRLNKTSTTNSMKKDINKIETISIELEHRVAKLIAKNKHLKQTYKQLYDSIKPSRVHDKEHAESLKKVFVITTLKNDLRKVKGNDIVDNASQVSNAITTALGRYKLDLVTLAPKDKNNRETHIYYLKHTMEQIAILREIVEQAISLNPLDSASYSPSSSNSDSEVDSCSKSCVKAYATLNEQYDSLYSDYKKSQFNLVSYKAGLGYDAATAASPAVESFVNLIDKSGSDKGYQSVPPPLSGNFIPRKPDLTFIDEIVESENLDVTTVVTPCNDKTTENKGVSNTVESNAVRMNNTSAPIIEDWNFDDESEIDYTIRTSTKKIKYVMTVRETDAPKQNKHHPRGKQRNWNNLMS
ncbi:hypothetical protein Tco_0183697 [Tanacetum coccineum]